uniref:Glycosyltransferase n=1 Tax=Anthurium amnicola TaxID=1678845 RepID=A0A1D1YEN6_9ARAE
MGSHQERSSRRDHVVVFPFMAKGHTIPLLHLSAALSRRGLGVTFVTTPGNSDFVCRALLPDPNVTLVLLPFPRVPSLPDGCESTDQLPSHHLYPAFVHATKLLSHPFHQALHRMSQSPASLPLCVVSDFFLCWTLPVCRHFGVPRLVSHGMGAFAMALCKGLSVNRTHLAAAAAGEDSFHLPGTPEGLRLLAADVPDTLRACDPADPAFQFVMETEESDVHSWGVLVNSFAELDGDYVAPLEAFYFTPGARAWLVGPLCLHRHRRGVGEGPEGHHHPCLEWLDGKPARSVVYVSFGTQADVSAEQLDEVARGLDMSGRDFVLVVRSSSWVPPEGSCRKGLVVRGWAPQEGALEHPSTGGFVSHCGWNSVLESLVSGVPILAWPMMAEQPLNAKYVVEELGAGLRVRETAGDVEKEGAALVGRREICEGVEELMGGGEKGTRTRKRAEQLGELARAAVADGGSSQQCLNKLVEELRRVPRVKNATQPQPDVSLEFDSDHNPLPAC